METIIKLVGTLFDKNGNSARTLFQLLLVLFFFAMLALIPLWIASKLKILPSSNITIENGPSTSGVANVIEHEKSIKLFDNVEIYSDVLTLDDLNFTREEQSLLEKYRQKFNSSRVSSKIDLFKSGFSITDKFSSQVYPYQNTSFKRFFDLFSDTLIDKNLATMARKEVFLSEAYWEMVNKGLDVYVFPPARQASIAVLRIFGAKSEGTLYTGIDDQNEDINNAIIKATGQRTINIPNNENYLYVCVTGGEKLGFESANFSWTITVSSILNVPASRGQNDVTIVDWTSTNK